MLSVTKQYRTETGHRLHKYNGKCAHIHGHSYLWEVTATSDKVDGLGMIVDFGDLKNAMIFVLEPFDHAMVLNEADPLAKLQPSVFNALFKPTGDRMANMKPRKICLPSNPTAEFFAEFAAEKIQRRLHQQYSSEVTVTHVRVWETATCHADWHMPTFLGVDMAKEENTDA